MRGWAAALAAVTLAAAGACSGDDDGGTATSARGEPTTTATPERLVRLDRPGGPDWLTRDDEFVYVRRDSGAVDRLDPATGEVVASVVFGGDLCQGIGAGFGAVWTCRGADVVRLDHDAEAVSATIAVNKANQQGTLPAGQGRIWVLVGDGSTLVGIDAETNEPGDPIPLSVRGTDVHADDTGVWVVSSVDDTVLFVNPATGAEVWMVTVPGAQYVVSGADGDVWVASPATTSRLDGATGAVELTFDIGPGREGGIAVDGNDLWIRSTDRFLERLDATTGEVLEEFDADVTSGGDMLVAFGAVWTSAYEDAAVFRLAA